MRVIDQREEQPSEAVKIDAPGFVRLKGQNCKSNLCSQTSVRGN